MQRLLLGWLVALGAGATALGAGATALGAQDSVITIEPRGRREAAAAAARLEVRQLPRDVADEVVRFVNAPGTIHFAGDTRIPAGRGVDGDVAVLGGPVVVAGRVSGDLVVVNGDLEFQEGAVVGGDVLVVGGSIEGLDRARVGGEIRAYRDPLRYRREGEAIVYAPRRGPGDGEWAWARRVSWSGRGSRTGFLVATGGTYNRFEGLPIVFGPAADLRLAGDARVQLETRAIFRTGGDLSFNTGDFGHSIRSELVLGGRESNLGLGGRLYDAVASIEPWPLRDFEVGWSSFLLHRDYRDYYRRHGGSLYATLRITRQFQLSGEARDERHFSLQARDPWTLFRNSQEWRANPEVDAGRYRSAIGSIKLDTRNDRTEPTSGWYLAGEFETALGTGLTFGPCPATAGCLAFGAPADGEVNYRRMMVDLRRYNRISPAGRLNFRGIAAGWVGGDPLPLQRRLSLGFPDPMPGLRIREVTCGGERVSGGALPALCDRLLVGQVEFRTHLGFDFGPDWVSDMGDDAYEPFHVSGPDLVVFADIGSAWLVGEGPGRLRSDRLPVLGSFETDVGIGLAGGPLGLYMAKGLSGRNQPVRFSLRMGRRF